MAVNYNIFTWDIASKESIDKMLAEARRLQFEKYLKECEQGQTT